MNKYSKVIIIDDEPDLFAIFEDMIMGVLPLVKIEFYKSWSELNLDLVPKDAVIISDHYGIGSAPKNIPCRVLVCSGSQELNPDIPKPFTFDILSKLLGDNK